MGSVIFIMQIPSLNVVWCVAHRQGRPIMTNEINDPGHELLY